MSETSIGCVAVIEHPAGSDSFVLVEETKRHKRRRLNLPGGRIDLVRPGRQEETVAACVRREAREETGLDIEVFGFLRLFRYTEAGQMHIAVAARAIGGSLQASAKHPTVDTYPFDGQDIPDAEAADNPDSIMVFSAAGRLRSDRVMLAISQFRAGLVYPLELVMERPQDSLPLPLSPESDPALSMDIPHALQRQ